MRAQKKAKLGTQEKKKKRLRRTKFSFKIGCSLRLQPYSISLTLLHVFKI